MGSNPHDNGDNMIRDLIVQHLRERGLELTHPDSALAHGNIFLHDVEYVGDNDIVVMVGQRFVVVYAHHTLSVNMGLIGGAPQARIDFADPELFSKIDQLIGGLRSEQHQERRNKRMAAMVLAVMVAISTYIIVAL